MARWSAAEVSRRKILGYLLSMDHPIGHDKAVFFSAMGYTRNEWTRLRDDLLRVVREGRVVLEEQTYFGMKYVVDGSIQAPTGQMINLRTVWMGDGPDDSPRLVTAYPG